jgi:hypothetical protein
MTIEHSMPDGAAPPPATQPIAAAAPEPGVVGVRQLIGASLDLLLRSGELLRRASFYVGVIVLGTVGPLILAVWGLVIVGYELAFMTEAFWVELGSWLGLLGFVAFAGIMVASIESQAMVLALLGGQVAGRPITLREGLQRSRMVFWAVIGASLVVSIPTSLLQNLIGQSTQQALILGFAVGIVLQAPFVYAASGIVLGDVGPVEALKRSIGLVRARKAAAVLLALLPTAFGLLVLVALESGLDVALRAVEALGLGSDSGPAGLAVLTVLLVALVFAGGTLLLTAAGIIYAPQAVMFVGLTRATMGLDRVRPGGDRSLDPPAWGTRRTPFRWLTRPMLAGFALGAIGVAGLLATASG